MWPWASPLTMKTFFSLINQGRGVTRTQKRNQCESVWYIMHSIYKEPNRTFVFYPKGKNDLQIQANHTTLRSHKALLGLRKPQLTFPPGSAGLIRACCHLLGRRRKWTAKQPLTAGGQSGGKPEGKKGRNLRVVSLETGRAPPALALSEELYFN